MDKKKELAEIIDIIFTSICNILWLGAWLYIIFILHNSGWWILIPMIFHFKTDKVIIERKEE